MNVREILLQESNQFSRKFNFYITDNQGKTGFDHILQHDQIKKDIDIRKLLKENARRFKTFVQKQENDAKKALGREKTSNLRKFMRIFK